MTTARRHPTLAVRDIDGAVEAVREAGGRLTRPRRAVLEALFATDEPVSAEQIAAGLDGRLTPTDLTSAYRNLEWLEDLGVVRHVHVGHGPGLYALAGERAREYLVCERCARVTAIDAAELARARAAIRTTTGFEAHFDHFPIHGLCAACAAR
jgi:Fur family ferric uptake transcriptional regulator